MGCGTARSRATFQGDAEYEETRNTRETRNGDGLWMRSSGACVEKGVSAHAAMTIFFAVFGELMAKDGGERALGIRVQDIAAREASRSWEHEVSDMR